MTSNRRIWLRFFAAALALFMLVGFSGCDGDEEQSESSETSEVEPEEPPQKVGFIFRDSVEKGGFTGQINDQRLKAAKRSGMETVYIENVSISDFESAVKALISDGCTYIVACSRTYTNILDSVSGKYMNVNFINYGATGGTANVCAYTEIAYQGAYVAGVAAAYNSDTHKIGMVVDEDMQYTTATINAAALGMQLVITNKTGGLYVASATEDAEIRRAVNALTAEGCDVIISYTESPYTAEYCEQNKIKFIGNLDYSGREEDYSNMIMYFDCERDSFFLSQFKQLQLETWAPITYVGTMANGIINVSGALDGSKDKSELQRVLDELTPLITTGAAYIFNNELKDNNGVVKYLQGEMMSQTDIYNMSWYVEGVHPIGNFREPQYELQPNDFTIKS